MKKLVVIALLVIGGLWVCKKTNLPSYAATLWKNGRQAVQNQVPRQFEMDRVRNEIAKLDGDVRALLSPIAEKQVRINELDQEVKTARANLKERREQLAALTAQVETGKTLIHFGGDEYTLDEAKAKLARDFAAAKGADDHLKTQEKLLAAHRENVRIAQEQLTKIIEVKREFELRLAQLETAEENLAIQRIVTPLKVDRSRIADIDNTLKSIKRDQDKEVIQRDLLQKYDFRANPTARPTAPAVNLSEVKAFLGIRTTPAPSPDSGQ